MTDTKVTRNEDESRYEARVDGELAGFIDFEVDGDRIVFTHTEVFDEHRGGGVAGTLAGDSLKEATSRKLTIVPQCAYIARYLDRHDIEGVTVETSE